MQNATRMLWTEQDRHPGDRLRLFSAVAGRFDITSVLYPGSFVDVAPSFVFASTTYVDSDQRAAAFFSDAAGVDEIIGDHRQSAAAGRWRFLHRDYTSVLDLPEDHFDLLVSLYAGFVSEHCTRYLRPGGLLLVNPSHGDAAMASFDPRYRLVAVVTSRSGGYRIKSNDLEGYLVPRRATEVTAEMVRRTGRGIAYTRPAFAYVFEQG